MVCSDTPDVLLPKFYVLPSKELPCSLSGVLIEECEHIIYEMKQIHNEYLSQQLEEVLCARSMRRKAGNWIRSIGTTPSERKPIEIH